MLLQQHPVAGFIAVRVHIWNRFRLQLLPHRSYKIQSSGKCLRLDHDRWSGCPWTVTNGISSLAECLSVTINVLLLYNDFIMIRKINFNSNRMGDNCRPYSISAQHARHFLGKVDNYSFQMITICDSFNAIGCPLCLPAVDSFNHISLFHARFGV